MAPKFYISLRYWQTRTHCCGHIVAYTNVSPFARAHNRADTILCPGLKKCFWFCSETFCDFTIKVNVKKQRRFDRSTVIFKLKSKKFLYALKYTIDYKNANEILTKTLKYLHRNNTSNCYEKPAFSIRRKFVWASGWSCHGLPPRATNGKCVYVQYWREIEKPKQDACFL